MSPGSAAATRLRRWGAPLLPAAVIFLLSHRPGSDYPSVDLPGLDKVVHVALYTPLGYTLHLATGGLMGRTLLLGGLYGLSDEWHQSFVPSRESSAGDVAADLVGVGLGAWLRRRRTTHSRAIAARGTGVME